MEFVYPTVTAVVPANIGLVSGGKNPRKRASSSPSACRDAGQELLLDPKVSRLPVLPAETLGAKVPADYPKIFEIAKRAKVQFDSNLSESRYYLVSSLFDQTVTFRHKELQAATKAIHDAEAALAKKPNARGQGTGEAGSRPGVRADRQREPGEGSASSSRPSPRTSAMPRSTRK